MIIRKVLKSFAVVCNVLIVFALCYNGKNLKPCTNAAANADVSTIQANVAIAVSPTLIPPQDFNPLTATDTDLKKYGFPQKPTDEYGIEQWTIAMENAKQYVYPDQTALDEYGPSNGKLVRSHTSGNWCGYDVNSKDNGSIKFNSVGGTYTIPSTYTGSYCPSYWVGLGGVNSGNIIQAGVWSNARYNNAINAVCEYWIEDYPDYPILEKSPVISRGNTAYTEVEDDNGVFNAFLENETTGAYTIVKIPGSHRDDTTADYILEAVNCLQDNFGSNKFSSNYFIIQNSTTSKYLQNYNYEQWQMTYEKCSSLNSDGSFITNSTY